MAQEVGFPHYSHLLCTFSLISLFISVIDTFKVLTHWYSGIPLPVCVIYYSRIFCFLFFFQDLYFSFPGGHSSSGVLHMSVLQIDVGTQAVKRDALLKCLSLE